MESEQEFEYEQDNPYVDEEKTEEHPTDEADSDWPPQFCEGCGFAILDCVCGEDGAKNVCWAA